MGRSGCATPHLLQSGSGYYRNQVLSGESRIPIRDGQ
jgi:hypothetical protein